MAGAWVGKGYALRGCAVAGPTDRVARGHLRVFEVINDLEGASFRSLQEQSAATDSGNEARVPFASRCPLRLPIQPYQPKLARLDAGAVGKCPRSDVRFAAA